MGRVYAALDTRTGHEVALKMLLEVDPAQVYRLKREFRRMADVAHHNLVTLHELFVDGDVCCFTMELVPGVDFRSAFARSLGSRYARLREGLRQLTHGVHALHQAGRVHRDLKPHNVLVSPNERVVVLDFGIASEIEYRTLFTDTRGLVQGTPAYMAPEQAAGQLATPASDWYAVGVILFETLTERLPFVGGVMQMLLDKQYEEPPLLSSLRPDVDPALDALVAGLLSRSPSSRPGPNEILAYCAGSRRRPSLPPVAVERPRLPKILLGREVQLATLTSAFEDVRGGRASWIDIVGDSGTGKTSLIRAFTDGLHGLPEVVVFAGRCSERESVPYRAFDAVVDQLAAYLLGLPADEREELLAPIAGDFQALTQIFPVLRRVWLDSGLIANKRENDGRYHAFAALEHLLVKIAERSILVLVIDDLHRGDLDSARLLGDLFSTPDAPCVLLLCAYDREIASTAVTIRDLDLLRAMLTAPYSYRVVETTPLSVEQSIELARLRMGGSKLPIILRRARQIAREAEGNPMLIEALADDCETSTVLSEGRTSTLGRVGLLRRLVNDRLGGLHPEARILLEYAAITRGRTPASLLGRASGVASDLRTLVTQLVGARLVHVVDAAGDAEIDILVAPMRAAVLEATASERAVVAHERIARTMITDGLKEPEPLAYHLAAAGLLDEAAEYAAQAAYAAWAAHAPEQAAELYALAVRCRPRAWVLQRQFADALVAAGHPQEAAEAYLVSSKLAPAASASKLLRAAGDAWLASGQISRGASLLGELLEIAGIPVPNGAEAAGELLRHEQERLSRRGYEFIERSEIELHRRELERVDLLWIAGRGLLLDEPRLAAYFLARCVNEALEIGEPRRLARCLATLGMLLCARGDEEGLTMIEAARTVARSVGDHEVAALAAIGRGVALSSNGQLFEALAEFDHGVASLAEQGEHGGWEECLGQRGALATLLELGELRTLDLRTRRLHQRVSATTGGFQRGVLTAYFHGILMLAAGDPSRAREGLQATLARWPRGGFYTQHLQALELAILCDLYESRPEDAWRRLAQRWSDIEASGFLAHRPYRRTILELRIRSALALAATNPREHVDLVHIVRDDIAIYANECTPQALAIAAGYDAALHSIHGDRARALNRLDEANRAFDASDLRLRAAICRRYLGIGRGDATLITRAETFLAMQSIADARRWSQMFVPGFATMGEYT